MYEAKVHRAVARKKARSKQAAAAAAGGGTPNKLRKPGQNHQAQPEDDGLLELSGDDDVPPTYRPQTGYSMTPAREGYNHADDSYSDAEPPAEEDSRQKRAAQAARRAGPPPAAATPLVCGQVPPQSTLAQGFIDGSAFLVS